MSYSRRNGRNVHRDVTQTTAEGHPCGPSARRTIVLMATEDAVREALATVNDPEINRPITELGMVKSVEIGADGAVAVTVYLTVSGCPMRDTITQRVTEAVSRVEGVTRVDVTPGRDERRAAQGAGRGPARRPGRARGPLRQAGQPHPGLRGRVRQGRRGQVLGDGEPGGGHGRRRSEGRCRGRRHLRPQRAAHAGRRRPAHPGREHDHAAVRERREGHLHRHVHPGQRPGGLARPDAAPRPPAVPGGRLLGATSTSSSWTSRPAPATSRSPWPS